MSLETEKETTESIEAIDGEGMPELPGDGESIGSESEKDGEGKAEDDEVVVSIGDETPAEGQDPAPDWVKDLRKANREKEKRIRELEARLQSSAGDKKPEDLGPKPKLEDHDFDADAYEASLSAWYERKRKHDDEAARRDAEIANQQKEWQDKLDGYSKAKEDLRVRDFEDAEAVAQELPHHGVRQAVREKPEENRQQRLRFPHGEP